MDSINPIASNSYVFFISSLLVSHSYIKIRDFLIDIWIPRSSQSGPGDGNHGRSDDVPEKIPRYFHDKKITSSESDSYIPVNPELFSNLPWLFVKSIQQYIAMISYIYIYIYTVYIIYLYLYIYIYISIYIYIYIYIYVYIYIYLYLYPLYYDIPQWLFCSTTRPVKNTPRMRRAIV